MKCDLLGAKPVDGLMDLYVIEITPDIARRRTVDDAMLALARRAVAACERLGIEWRLDGVRVTNLRGEPRGRFVDGEAAGRDFFSARLPAGLLPGLSDAATLGCLLALVREAWGGPWASTLPCDHGRWLVVLRSPATDELGSGDVAGEGADEAEALVCALEAAPVREAQP